MFGNLVLVLRYSLNMHQRIFFPDSDKTENSNLTSLFSFSVRSLSPRFILIKWESLMSPCHYLTVYKELTVLVSQMLQGHAQKLPPKLHTLTLPTIGMLKCFFMAPICSTNHLIS